MRENPPVQRPNLLAHYLAFGLAGYLASLLSMVYFRLFLANLVVPKSIDSPPAGPTGRALVTDLALILAFGLVHSLMARQGFKERLERVFPAALERSLYSLVVGLQMACLCWEWQALPSPVWQVATNPAAEENPSLPRGSYRMRGGCSRAAPPCSCASIPTRGSISPRGT